MGHKPTKPVTGYTAFKALGQEVLSFVVDVASRRPWKRQPGRKFTIGVPDVLFNHVGIVVGKLFAEHTYAEIQHTLNLNVLGWMESLRFELEALRQDLQVTTVTPCYIDTGLFAGVKTPLLKPKAIAQAILHAVKKNKAFLRRPACVHLLPLLRGILSARLFDVIVGRELAYTNLSTSLRGTRSQPLFRHKKKTRPTP